MVHRVGRDRHPVGKGQRVRFRIRPEDHPVRVFPHQAEQPHPQPVEQVLNRERQDLSGIDQVLYGLAAGVRGVRNLQVGGLHGKTVGVGDDGRGARRKPVEFMVSERQMIVPHQVHDPHLGFPLQEMEQGAHGKVPRIQQEHGHPFQIPGGPDLLHPRGDPGDAADGVVITG